VPYRLSISRTSPRCAAMAAARHRLHRMDGRTSALPPPRLSWLSSPGCRPPMAMARSFALNPEDRSADVAALVAGRIAEWYVKDGERVAAGQPIARVVDLDPGFLTRLASERGQIEAEIAAVTQSRATAQLDVDRASALWREGLIARRDVELAQIKVAEGGAKLAESRAKLQRIDVQLARQSAGRARRPAPAASSTLNAALSGGMARRHRARHCRA